MRSQRIFQGLVMSTAAAAAALMLSACGPSQPEAQPTMPNTGTGPASSPASPGATSAEPTPSATPSATGTSTSSAAPAPGDPALCKASGLTAATDASEAERPAAFT
jgi:hypothetical protein